MRIATILALAMALLPALVGCKTKEKPSEGWSPEYHAGSASKATEGSEAKPPEGSASKQEGSGTK